MKKRLNIHDSPIAQSATHITLSIDGLVGDGWIYIVVSQGDEELEAVFSNGIKDDRRSLHALADWIKQNVPEVG